MKPKGLQDKSSAVRVFYSVEAGWCVWTAARGSGRTLCENAFDCPTCRVDKAMAKAGADTLQDAAGWRHALRSRPYLLRSCRHLFTGRFPLHQCPNAYRCSTCEFDQFLDARDGVVPRGGLSVLHVAGFLFAVGYGYHPSHAYVRIEAGGLLRLGQDDIASAVWGDAECFHLPEPGTRLEENGEAWAVERKGERSTQLSPVAGVVVAANQSLIHQPSLATADPYAGGWVLLVAPDNLRQSVKKLFQGERAETWFREEAMRLA